MPTDDHTFKPDFEGKCPCGGTFMIGKNEKKRPGVMHGEPPCERFIKLEVADYLAYVRRSMGVTMPWDGN